MNKKIVAFALSATALLGAGAMVETTPFNGMAANAAYAYETTADVVKDGSVGDGTWTYYSDGAFVVSGGTMPADVLAETIAMFNWTSDVGVTNLVFENTPVITGTFSSMTAKTDVKTVSGELVYSGSLADAFKWCKQLETVDLTFAQGSNVTDMSRMFLECASLTSVTLSGWDNMPVTSMNAMLQGCTSLTTVNVSEWKTGSATDLSYLFYQCSGLNSLDLSAWDVSSVENMSSMFGGCTSLAEVVTTGWTPASLKYLAYTYGGCTALTSADLSGFGTAALASADQTFSGCTALATVDVSGWDLSGACSLDGMFENCTALTSIDFTGWNVPASVTTQDMFEGAEKVSQLTLDSANGVGFLSGLPSSEDWVLSTNRKLGEFTVANLVSGWDNAKMAGVWYTASTAPEPEVTAVAVYRLYNPNSGEHFYTLSEVERDATVAAGWNDEGIGWYAPDESDAPVYRLYSGTDHHYTMDEEEKAALIEEGWKYEGVAFYSADPSEGIALLRQFNPFVDPEAATNNSGSHNYTTDQVENDYLVSLGWQAEDVAFYGMAVEDVEAPAPPTDGVEI
jgi:surface protein